MRRRYVYRPNADGALEAVEVAADWTGAERRAPTATEELVYGHAQATDGTDVSTRRRHREYMRANGLALASDFTNTWAKAAEERAKFFKDGGQHAARREAVARAIYALEKKGRR